MPNYSEIKKLDLESLEKLTDGIGPSDECICNLLSPPEPEKKKSMGASIKKAFGFGGGGKKSRTMHPDANGVASIDIPLTFTKGGKGLYTTKEEVKRKSSCGKCGCDDQKFVLKHSYANIKIISPDISSICPCPSNCLPDKAKLQNNIKVTIENVKVDLDSSDSEHDLGTDADPKTMEPIMERRSISELIEAQYDTEEYNISESSKWSNEDN